jgi:hypothetical protein
MGRRTWIGVFPPGDIPHIYVVGRVNGAVIYERELDLPESQLKMELDHLWREYQLPEREIYAAMRAWIRAQGKEMTSTEVP